MTGTRGSHILFYIAAGPEVLGLSGLRPQGLLGFHSQALGEGILDGRGASGKGERGETFFPLILTPFPFSLLSFPGRILIVRLINRFSQG